MSESSLMWFPIEVGMSLTYEHEILDSVLMNDVRMDVGIGQSEEVHYFTIKEKSVLPYIRGPSKATIQFSLDMSVDAEYT